ncbi:hypothetical protein [Alkaliphilus sp. B6464]|uniref:hypothetical protein n=1 Tax=Alkaliphilus sp. B6464 TaxID=2731219 RepID=UPI001BA78B36|nr:hypothetical protein [Alkaliphilus sp. B6464]QUH21246.1 hypothetical protein HYG84_16060 [Alkaliphilus sp. B6464]
MKNKCSITKCIAALLCIITMAISFNIYSSYKDLYLSDNLTKDSIIYIAAAKTSLKDSYESFSNKNMSSIKTEEISKSKSSINLNEDDVQKKIFINILILFLSFISLASIHNFIINTEKKKEYRSKKVLNTSINKNHNIKPTCSLMSKEGAK